MSDRAPACPNDGMDCFAWCEKRATLCVERGRQKTLVAAALAAVDHMRFAVRQLAGDYPMAASRMEVAADALVKAVGEVQS